jgi:hypothetical protein
MDVKLVSLSRESGVSPSLQATTRKPSALDLVYAETREAAMAAFAKSWRRE